MKKLLTSQSLNSGQPFMILVRSLLQRLFIMTCLVVAGLIQQAQAQPNRDDMLAEFNKTGDPQFLAKLWRIQHGLEPGLKLAAAAPGTDKATLIESDAELDLRVLSAVGKRLAMLAVERRPVAKTLTDFMEEMKRRTDQPFINPGRTKPEAIPDKAYRQRYVDFLAALKMDAKHAEIAGTLHSLEGSFRGGIEAKLESLTVSGRRRVLERVAPENISPEVARILSERFKLPFVYQNGKPIANLPAK